MRKLWIVIPSSLLVVAGALALLLLRPDPPESYKTASIERRDLEQLVTATGSLEPVVSVEVGTQVSGIVNEILVDFNDEVEAGQIVARIDPSLLEADVRTAEAGLAQSVAEAQRASLSLARLKALHERKAATDQEFETAVSEAGVARATRTTREVALERARRNLSYATVSSPIRGTVISRAVDVGQTVNAGLSAPKLFEIAQDLSRMQILAAVDEADIGAVSIGQPARFTVQAWGDQSFMGSVRQVRLEPSISDNVVTYTVVLDVDNTDGLLLPGMTATVDIISKSAEQVLCVPAAALRFQPSGVGAGPGAHLWASEKQDLRAFSVEVGLVGDECTQVTGEGIEEGMLVVTGAGKTDVKQTVVSSPFQQTPSGGGGHRGPPGGL